VFRGKHKAILVEPGNCLWALLDYIHLNPVRAGIVHREDGLENFVWSSLRGYLMEPGKRPKWLKTAMGLTLTGCEDRAAGRRRFLEILEQRIDWHAPSKAGKAFSAGEGKSSMAVYSCFQRGWFFRSQEFKEELLKRLNGIVPKRKAGARIAAAVWKDHGENRGSELIRAGLEVLGISAKELRAAAKSDWRKVLLAEMVQRETTVTLDWISKNLLMGDRSNCCRIIRRTRERMNRQKEWGERPRKIDLSINDACPEWH